MKRLSLCGTSLALAIILSAEGFLGLREMPFILNAHLPEANYWIYQAYMGSQVYQSTGSIGVLGYGLIDGSPAIGRSQSCGRYGLP